MSEMCGSHRSSSHWFLQLMITNKKYEVGVVYIGMKSVPVFINLRQFIRNVLRWETDVNTAIVILQACLFSQLKEGKMWAFLFLL
jgi:hypothetical protein